MNLTQTIFDMLLIAFGAFLSLYAYHCGRTGKAPIPELHLPRMLRRSNPDESNGRAETPNIGRGM